MRKSVLAVVFLLVATASASAQVRAGLNELNLNGHFSSTSVSSDLVDDSESFTALVIELRYGRFLTNRFELGGFLDVSKFEGVDLFGSIGAFGAYHFGAAGATTVPYLGATVGTGYGGEDDDNPLMLGAFGGLKFFLGPNGAISTEAFVERDAFDDVDLTSFGIRLGISVFF